jgi:hypothetical protein
MQAVIRKLQFLLFFAGGFVVGAFLYGRQNRSNSIPIETPYCFLAQNRDLFASRQIVTSAQIWVLEHGMSLADPGCLDGALSFTASRDIGGKVDELNAKLRAVEPLHKLPVTLVGTLHVGSRIENAYRWTRYNLGLSIRPQPEFIIDRVVSVGEATE